MKVFGKAVAAALFAATVGFFAIPANDANASPTCSGTTCTVAGVVTTSIGTNGGQPPITFDISTPQWNTAMSGIDAACLTVNTCTLASVQIVVTNSVTGSAVFAATGTGVATFTDSNGDNLSGYQIGVKSQFTRFLGGSGTQTTLALGDICDPAKATLVSIGCSNNVLTLNAGENSTATLIGSTNGNYDTGVVTNGAAISPYSDAGSFQFITSGTSVSFGSGSTSGTFSINGTYTDTLAATVTYTYSDVPPTTSVPEPASIALLGVGLAGLGLIRRKTSKTA